MLKCIIIVFLLVNLTSCIVKDPNWTPISTDSGVMGSWDSQGNYSYIPVHKHCFVNIYSNLVKCITY